MRTGFLCLAATALWTMAAMPAKAALIFSDDFEAQTLGDHTSDLIHWTGSDPDLHEVVLEGGSKALLFDNTTPANAGDNLRLRSTTLTQPFLHGNVLSVTYDVRHDSTASGAFGLAVRDLASPGGNDRYWLNISNSFNFVGIHKLGTPDAGGLDTVVPFMVGTSQRHYEFRITLGAGQTRLEAFADNSLVSSVTDSNPFLSDTSNLRLDFNVNRARSMRVVLDNVEARVTTAPEPSSLVLLAIGAVGLLGFGRRRRMNTPALVDQAPA